MAKATKSRAKLSVAGGGRYSPRAVGCITHFEHVNFRVPSHYEATAFFLHGLGLTRDPTRMVTVRNMWVNAGVQQFHLPLGEPATFDGEVGLIVPDLERAAADLEQARRALADTRFEFKVNRDDISVTSPWGHAFRLRSQAAAKSRLPQAIAYVRFDVAPGTATGIAAFYETFFSAPVEVKRRGKLAQATVNVGVNQYLHFVEGRREPNLDHPNHIAVYVTHYDAIYAALGERGLIMTPSRDEQFRFAKMACPDSGKILFEFEHEVRSLHHPDYRKPLANRVPVPYLVD